MFGLARKIHSKVRSMGRGRTSPAFRAVDRAMTGRRGDAVAYAWGLSEAVSFPITAEMCQVWLGVAQPRHLFRRAAMIVAGSVSGVAVTHLLTRAGRRPPAPWTTPQMEEATARYLGVGPRGYWKQAFTGIPVKLFAAESGRRDLDLPPVLAHALAERALRMVGATAVVLILEKPLGGPVRRYYGTYLALTGTAFALSLGAIVRLWRIEGAGDDPEARLERVSAEEQPIPAGPRSLP
ncbi:MAG: hypothetical protein Q3979_01665 [Actinomycetaceae bacterium]|nr:hypothetical protein [Actinomycetaceae bacterium]